MFFTTTLMFLVKNSLWKSFSTVNKDNFKLPYIIFGESCGLIEGRTLTLEQEGRESSNVPVRPVSRVGLQRAPSVRDEVA